MKKYYFILFTVLLYSSLNAQNINFPDANFKAKLVAATFYNGTARNLQGTNFKLDANSDGEIQESEAAQVSALFINNSNISNFTGILSFPNLEILDCHNNTAYSIDLNGLIHLRTLYCYNSFLSSLPLINVPSLVALNCTNSGIGSLDLSHCPNITDVNCNQSYLSSLNVSGLTNLHNLDCGTNMLTTLDVSSSNLTRLECQGNQLTTLDVSHSTNLQYLNCSSNNLTALNITGLTAIQTLWCSYNNNFTVLDVTPLTNLTDLDCSNTQIAVLDAGNLPNLTKLRCFNTQIATLDVSNSPNLGTLVCMQNPLMTSLFMKNGSDETYSLDFGGNPSLRYICADESQLTTVQTKLTNYNMTNCFVNSYCSFVPGGVYYTIQGATKYDEANDGCDAADINYRNLRLAITSGTTTGTLISNATGNYSLPVSAGTHVITPVLENPTYFAISPTTITKVFPAQPSPSTQDFCVTANGTHNDLEVTILPIRRARPGFDAKYKILYKNKGTNTQSGTISFAFNDAILDVVNANPTASSQVVNYLNWNFTDLHPFEARAIIVTLNANSPSEVPPVNSGDILNFTTSINGLSTDETPNDNTFTLNQTVVNSLDPNDKTCLEGTTITPEMVGKEVHYLIRFENTGTANAENIVVKDMIDTDKFDINSLIPMDGSASFVTKISGNKVEFIFENINLPFDDANNDGYVAFKIKTKPTLVLGDFFSNTGSIYFDYNSPIITNTATTTVALLANPDFTFDNYFKIYPNPVKDFLNIETKKTIEVTSVNIYNTLGQLVLIIPSAQQTKSVDVSNLKIGNYFMKINSDKGSSNTKFIKM